MSDDPALRELYILKSRMLREMKEIIEQRRQEDEEFRCALQAWQQARATQADLETDTAFLWFMEQNTVEHAALVEQYEKAREWGIRLDEAIAECWHRSSEAWR